MDDFDASTSGTSKNSSMPSKAASLSVRTNRRSFSNTSLYRELLSSLNALPRQAFFTYVYCFVLVLVIAFLNVLRPFLMIGIFLGLAGVFKAEASRLAFANIPMAKEHIKTLLAEVKMNVGKNISEILHQQLKNLTEEDIGWVLTVGYEKKIPPNEILINEQQPIDSLYIILSGTFEISTMNSNALFPSRLSDKRVQLSVVDSHIIGEMSFIREGDYLPSATVKAVQESSVWLIPRHELKKKISQDLEFGVRFYQLLSSILADRLDSSNKLRSASESQKKDKIWKLNLPRNKQSFNSSPITNLTPGMLLFIIDSCPT